MDSPTVAALCSSAAVPMTMPATSPIAQPVRQCKVACAAVDHGTVRHPRAAVMSCAEGCSVTGCGLLELMRVRPYTHIQVYGRRAAFAGLAPSLSGMAALSHRPLPTRA